MPITPRRHVRDVLDAGYDLNGVSDLESSIYTGWTTNLISYHIGQGANTTTLGFIYRRFEDDQGLFPKQDGVAVVSINQNTIGVTGFSTQTDVGIRHYFQQAQAMKGYNFHPGNPMMEDFPNNSSTPSFNGVGSVYDGTGRYTQTDVSLGSMRGLRYSVEDNSVWDSSDNSDNSGNEERLRDTGAISIGTTA